jgi:uncharacterized membrane protein YkvA (DUF1232 family)
MADKSEGVEAPVEAFHPPVATAGARRRVRERFWPKLWRVVGYVPFSEDLAAAWYCAVDPRTATRVKFVLMGALAYFIVPADLIPDLLVSVGFTDDATVLATALGVVGAHIKERHRQSARRRLGKPEPASEEE